MNYDNYPWSMLELDGECAEERSIKRAYAKLAKQFRPEKFPKEFEEIRLAYEQALHHAAYLREHGDDDAPSEVAAGATTGAWTVVTASASETPEPQITPVAVLVAEQPLPATVQPVAPSVPFFLATEEPIQSYRQDEWLTQHERDDCAIDALLRHINSLFDRPTAFQSINEAVDALMNALDKTSFSAKERSCIALLQSIAVHETMPIESLDHIAKVLELSNRNDHTLGTAADSLLYKIEQQSSWQGFLTVGTYNPLHADLFKGFTVPRWLSLLGNADTRAACFSVLDWITHHHPQRRQELHQKTLARLEKWRAEIHHYSFTKFDLALCAGASGLTILAAFMLAPIQFGELMTISPFKVLLFMLVSSFIFWFLLLQGSRGKFRASGAQERLFEWLDVNHGKAASAQLGAMIVVIFAAIAEPLFGLTAQVLAVAGVVCLLALTMLSRRPLNFADRWRSTLIYAIFHGLVAFGLLPSPALLMTACLGFVMFIAVERNPLWFTETKRRISIVGFQKSIAWRIPAVCFIALICITFYIWITQRNVLPLAAIASLSLFVGCMTPIFLAAQNQPLDPRQEIIVRIVGCFCVVPITAAYNDADKGLLMMLTLLSLYLASVLARWFQASAKKLATNASQ